MVIKVRGNFLADADAAQLYIAAGDALCKGGVILKK